jgi:putative (di)nucleoside polyphosphate hydrolase
MTISTVDKSQLPYRPSVGLMLLNKDNKVFVGKRIDSKVEAWQMPQGGIDEGEDALEAARRELKEEIGTCNVEVITMSQEWFFYDIPDYLVPKLWNGQYRGQKQKWFLMRFLGTDAEINIKTEHPEFSSWRWAEFEILPEIIVPFKKQLYLDVINAFYNNLYR